MKKQIVKSIVVITLVTLVSIVAANAQASGRVATSIPFDFNVGGQKFTAGDYILEKAVPLSNNAILIIRQNDGKASRILMMLPLSGKEKNTTTGASLFFNRYGSNYFLSDVANSADGFGARMPKSKEETILSLQSVTPTRETIALNPVKH